MKRRRPLAAASWKDHERHVGTLYDLLGFTVGRDLNSAGKQTDLLCAKQIPGAGEIKLFVDTKYSALEESDYVDPRLVEQFITTFHARKQPLGWTAGVLVSNRSFSKSAKEMAALHKDIVLKTLDELYDDVLQVKPYLQSFVHNCDHSRTLQRLHRIIFPSC
jgi:hypothetical protein